MDYKMKMLKNGLNYKMKMLKNEYFKNLNDEKKNYENYEKYR